MGIVRVQGNKKATAVSNTYTIALDSTPVEGNIIILVHGGYDSGSNKVISSVVQTNVTWSQAKGNSQYRSSNGWYIDVEIWIGIVGASASKNIVVTTTAITEYIAGDACEYSGVKTISPLDKTASNGGQAVTAADVGTTATTTQANELWIGAAAVGSSGGSDGNLSNPTNGFTLLDGAMGYPLTVGYFEKIVTAKGTANTSATIAASNTYAGCIATFIATVQPPKGASHSIAPLLAVLDLLQCRPRSFSERIPILRPRRF